MLTGQRSQQKIEVKNRQMQTKTRLTKKRVKKNMHCSDGYVTQCVFETYGKPDILEW